jgi:hypothetical protein
MSTPQNSSDELDAVLYDPKHRGLTPDEQLISDELYSTRTLGLVETQAKMLARWYSQKTKRLISQARIDEVNRAIKWFEEESGYLFYLDDRLAALTKGGDTGGDSASRSESAEH